MVLTLTSAKLHNRVKYVTLLLPTQRNNCEEACLGKKSNKKTPAKTQRANTAFTHSQRVFSCTVCEESPVKPLRFMIQGKKTVQ